MRWLIAVSVLVLANAYSHAATLDEDAVRLTEQAEAVTQKDSGNCPKMASDLRALHERNAGLIDRLRSGFQARPLGREYRPRMNAALSGILAGSKSCAADRGVSDALEVLPR